MSITYTWKVTGIQTSTVGVNQNVIVQTFWEKTGTDENGNVGVFKGATPFSPEEINKANLKIVPLAKIKEKDVLDWIKKVVVDDYERHVNEQIQKQIDDLNATKRINNVDLPWAK